ncbi:MAG: TfoX/Sxy family protein [Piscinibacter sp.]|uniref:TfoX/Sxy family protein n=1 Tax=Piscinibacter sp. TaxID=1903157 RepID=UPI0025865D35|nr:TfoX/Sxy family protein [Piscinibacter sp.]MCW5667623.1 TfoX/Sxy family protein [Piscinibacter sp.]
MAPADGFVTHCLELLAPLGVARSRRMFGGHGLYVDELSVALIAFERLYLKADEQTRPQFESAGCSPFVYDGKGRSVTLGYYTAPEEAMESPALMRPWARLALEAALRARAATTPAAQARSPKARAPRR